MRHAGWVNGQLILRGVDLEALYLDTLLDVLHALLLESTGKPLEAVHDALEQPYWVERDTWGTGTTAEAGHRAMMALSGGPARRREPTPTPDPEAEEAPA